MGKRGKGLMLPKITLDGEMRKRSYTSLDYTGWGKEKRSYTSLDYTGWRKEKRSYTSYRPYTGWRKEKRSLYLIYEDKTYTGSRQKREKVQYT